jgi:aspartate/methionine/tyrosine aminotransferase
LATDGFEPFEYGRYYRSLRPGARFPLHVSGVSEAGLADLGPDGSTALPIEGRATGAALALWRERLAARYGVPAAHLLPASGAHGAVFLALTALHTRLPRGASIAVERPGYGISDSVARLAGRRVVPVDRLAANGYALDSDAVERAFRGGARVFCVANLNNPTGAALTASELSALGDIARRHDGWILVNEVYRDFLPGPAATAYRPGERFICLSSLTKCYGLGGLRAGWLLADPEIVARADDLAEIVGGSPPTATLHLASRALAHADELLARGRAFAAAGRPLIDEWMAATPNVSWVPPAAGITGLVRVDGVTDSIGFAERLREELDVQVSPGAYFGAEGHVRVSFGLPPKDLAAALCVLGMGIPALRD